MGLLVHIEQLFAFYYSMDIESLVSLILQELKLIRNDMNREVQKLSNEVKILHTAVTKQTVTTIEQGPHNQSENSLRFESSTSLEMQQHTLNKLNDDINMEILPDDRQKDLLVSVNGACTDKCDVISPRNLTQKTLHRTDTKTQKTLHRTDISNCLIESLNHTNFSIQKIFDQKNDVSGEIVDESTVSCTGAVITDVQSVNEPKCFVVESLKPEPYSEELHSCNLINEVLVNDLEEKCSDSLVESNNDTDLYKFNSCPTDNQDHSDTNLGANKSKVNFKCKFCTESFFGHSDYIAHIKMHSTSNKNFSCKHCSEIYSNKTDLNKHMIRYHGKSKFSCKYCNEIFVCKFEHEIHIRRHTGQKLHNCSVCSKSFIHISQLNIHSRKHTGEKSFKCSICNKSFSLSSNLTTHMRIHTGEKPYKCSFCNKSFTQLSNLNTHTTRIHAGEKQLKINVYNTGFI